MDAAYDMLRGAISRAFGISESDLDAYVAARRAKARARVENKNRAYANALAHMTDVQAVMAERMEAEGYKMIPSLRQDRATLNVALFFQKECWNSAKGKVGKKLVALYPDGARSETFERSISVKSKF